MKEFLEKLGKIDINKDRVRILDKNAIQIIKERGCLVISKGGEDNYTIVSILEDKTEEEVLKFIEEYK